MNYKTLYLAKQLLLITTFLLICSCSTTPMKGYTGPDLPASQTVLIQAVKATNMVTCNGIKLGVSQNEVIVLPGTHNVEITWRGGIESYSNEVILVTLKAEAGHTYEISAESVPGARWDVFTTDKTTGERVGNNRPSTKSDEEALAFINRQMPFNSNSEVFWNERGMTLHHMKRYEEAIKAYDKAIEIKPDYLEAWNNKGAAFSYLNKQEEVLKYYDKAIEIKPDYAEAWNNKGAALFYLGKKEEALKCYEKAKALGFVPEK